MTMRKTTNFLESVARYYAAGEAGRPVHENIVYVLPNKRSALFMKQYVRRTVSDVALMPRFMTLRTFLSLHSPFPEGDRLEQLFILYDAYRTVMERKGRSETTREFDAFLFWGEMILSDFDDIDKSLANANDLFRNLKNVKEIQADYLDDDQKEVIRRIWGESRLTAEADRFWLHLNDDNKDGVAARFLYLWQILGDLYTEFQHQMTARGFSSAGAQYRSAANNIGKLGKEDFDGQTYYAFVGFNDLTTSETLIFDRLKRLGVASFFWDTAPIELAGKGSSLYARPLKRLAELAKHFPMPQDYELPLPKYKPEVHVVSVPSNVGQAKALAEVLGNWYPEPVANPIETAVVLPDQNLLIPALMSVPAQIESLNISMGLAYRTTTFAGLLHSIIGMQLRGNIRRGEQTFFYADVEAVLTHPHIQTLASTGADAMRRKISDERLYNIPVSTILAVAPELQAIFTPVRSLASVLDVAAYLKRLLEWLNRELTDRGTQDASNGFEINAIAFFQSEIERLEHLIVEHSVEMQEHTFLQLFERVFNTRGLTVSGTPLRGMQMLGVLETRCLDFEKVAVLSMNERIFPRKQYTKTMIPNSLRLGYGLPDFESLEWTYAYCFYRLMARARHVVLMYDSRADGLGGGEMSRYISQMNYLMPNVNVTFRSLGYGAEPSAKRSIVIDKHAPEVRERLRRFMPGGKLRLSASAIKDYRNCPLSFYLKYACCMRGSDDIVDYISAAQYGTAVHNTIQAMLVPYAKSLITADILGQFTNPDDPRLLGTARAMVIAERYPTLIGKEDELMPAEGEIAAQIVAAIAAADFKAEREAYCNPDFTFVENEMKLPPHSVWKISPELSVNFTMSVDRVDRIDATTLRFIDFKTGSEETSVADLTSLFKGKYNHSKSGILQLLLYCEAYRSIVDETVDIVPMLHPLRNLANGEPLTPLRINKENLLGYAAVADTVRPLIAELIGEIFDPEVPFKQCDDAADCVFCPFLRLCGRVVPENF